MKRECQVGWMVAPSPTDGEYVPFFVKVRDKDIIWDENTITRNFASYLSKYASDVTLHYPMNEWKCTIDGWVVTVYQDGTYHARKKVNIQKNARSITDFRKIYLPVKLPLTTFNDDKLGVSITSAVTANDLLTSFTNFRLSDDKKIDNIEVELTAMGNSYYDDFFNNVIYANQYLFIIVEGTIALDQLI
jgi:hypothetical protein